MMKTTIKMARIMLLWALIFAATMQVGLTLDQVEGARRAASPPLAAQEVAAVVRARIEASPEAAGHWMVVGERGGWLRAHARDLAQDLARAYLSVLGEARAADWVEALRQKEGPVWAVLVYAGDEGLPPVQSAGQTAAVLCLPGQASGGWVALFWNGPWGGDRGVSSALLSGVCVDHAPLSLKDVPWA